jgi:hypothetical protein
MRVRFRKEHPEAVCMHVRPRKKKRREEVRRGQAAHWCALANGGANGGLQRALEGAGGCLVWSRALEL